MALSYADLAHDVAEALEAEMDDSVLGEHERAIIAATLRGRAAPADEIIRALRLEVGQLQRSLGDPAYRSGAKTVLDNLVHLLAPVLDTTAEGLRQKVGL